MSILTSSPRRQKGQLILGVLGLLAFLGAGLLIAPGQADAQSHVCIESPEVQDAGNSAGASVGNEIITDEWDHYFITKGGPTCTLDPTTCDASLNLYLVDDVKKCLAATAGADTADDAAASADTAAHSASTESSLAHTGEEHELAGAFATALIGAGCAALGVARAERRRRKL